MQEEQLILVDESDIPRGMKGKTEVHKKGLLHRAFSVIIYNKHNELLLQRRADIKYHSAGLWCNSCCGHPRLEESNIDAAKRRLEEELGFSCDLSKITELSYNLPLDRGLSEHEYTHIFAGIYEGDIYPNPDEVSETKWLSLESILEDLDNNPKDYAAWFRLYLNRRIIPATFKY